MRTIFLFFLSISVLALTSVGWYLNLSRLDNPHSIKNIHERIDKIRGERNIDKVKRQAVDLILGIDEYALERERGINKGQSFLFLAMFLSGIAVVISFSEVAARGKAIMAKEKGK